MKRKKLFLCLAGLLGLLLIITLPVHARGHGSGSHGGHGSGGHGGAHTGRHGGGHGRFFPGLIVGGVLGWGLAPNYYYPLPYYYPPADYYYPPPDYYYYPPGEVGQTPPSAGQTLGTQLFIYPRAGQNEAKQDKDREECQRWAFGQTGFDPTKPPVGPTNSQTIQNSADYFRAISACLDARGYTVR
jgi:hypothetical protein